MLIGPDVMWHPQKSNLETLITPVQTQLLFKFVRCAPLTDAPDFLEPVDPTPVLPGANMYYKCKDAKMVPSLSETDTIKAKNISYLKTLQHLKWLCYIRFHVSSPDLPPFSKSQIGGLISSVSLKLILTCPNLIANVSVTVD